MSDRLPRYRNCFVCGADNPCGLHLSFSRAQDGGIETIWIPDERHAGFEGVMHGGVIGAVLDEIMFWAIWSRRNMLCFTVEMTLSFRRTVEPGRSYAVRGTVDEAATGRFVHAAASLSEEGGGPLCARAKGRFLPVPEEERARLTAGFRGLDERA